jgi:hypothetical protein
VRPQLARLRVDDLEFLLDSQSKGPHVSDDTSRLGGSVARELGSSGARIDD